MPKRYEAIRDSMAKKMPMAEAKEKAAKTYNATRKKGEPPVTGHTTDMKTAMKGLGGKY